MCCLHFILCQHHHQFAIPHNSFGRNGNVGRHGGGGGLAGLSGKVSILVLPFIFVLVNLSSFGSFANAQIAYTRQMSELRIQELHNMAIRLEHSLDVDKYVCDDYFDYVCGRNRPLFSVLGHLPDVNELIQLLTELQNDTEQFEAKQKLMDFFISCNSIKNLEDCYRITFEYFKPLFGYIITKYHIDVNSHELKNFLEIFDNFLKKVERTENFYHHQIRDRLVKLRDKFRNPQLHFRFNELNAEYQNLRIYRESYTHNLRNLELHRKLNSTYEFGFQKVMLDWSLYLYQSRNKPMSYYYPTFNVHLWMTFYNTTERHHEPKRLTEIAECLKLSQFVNVLDEARILAVVYLKSFNKAWEDYQDWITSSSRNIDVVDQENEILRQYQLSNDKIFFTLYGQNFCEFGKDIAQKIFYLGLKHSSAFAHIYSCGPMDSYVKCI